MTITETIQGHSWLVLNIDRFRNGRRKGDGDTLNLHRATTQLLGDKVFELRDFDPLFHPCRLAWVQCPESKKDPAGYTKATNDFNDWLARHLSEHNALEAICFGTAGWDRELIDLRCMVDGESASQWLMTEGNDGQGWPAYQKS
jgi:hypothetical protein